MLALIRHRRLPRVQPLLKPQRASPLRITPITRLCSTQTKPYYITTPIFYPNAVPHIGHLYTLVLGDIFARYQHQRNPDVPVKFLAGTDEHGMKIQLAAAKAAAADGRAPDTQAFCDELSRIFQGLSASANVSYTTYARTTEAQHKEAVAHVWQSLYEKGYIYKGEYEGWYSITDECFYTTAQIVETADGSGKFVSKETGSQVDWSKEHNYMFRLSAFRDALIQHYSQPTPVVTPVQYNSVVLQMLAASEKQVADEPPLLPDISISRPKSRLTWGIPVPNDPDHTVYVWFDALLIYLSGTGYPASTTGWPPNLQIIGKDILRFHALYLPATLMALGAPSYSSLHTQSPSQILESSVPLPHRLLTHAHWTVSQQKMSKSIGNVVDPVLSIEKYGLDIVRFYLARVGGRFRDDVDWSFEQLEKHSRELQSLLGNYLLRITSKRITAVAEEGRQEAEQQQQGLHDLNAELRREADALPAKVQELMDNFEVAEALAAVLNVLKLANKVVTDIAPWAKTCPPALVSETRRTGLDTLRIVAVCLRPFVPDTAERLLNALGLAEEDRTWESVKKGCEPVDMWVERKVDGVRLF